MGSNRNFEASYIQQARPETVALFGLPISNVTMAGAVHRIEEAIRSRETHQIATANLDFARNALCDQELQRVICDCSMVLPDGAPMLWASRLLGNPLQERVTGVDLIPELARLSAGKGYRIFFLGSSEKNLVAASLVLEKRFPGVQIVGRYAPPVGPLHTMDNGAILRQVRLAAPDILLVAFGNPKQEFWIHRFKDLLQVPVQIGIGGSFEMISGSVRRAPVAIQKLQMEWLYRVAQEPRRLLLRYLRDAAALLGHLPLEFAVHRMQPEEDAAGEIEVISGESVRELILPSRLSGFVCEWLEREARIALAKNQNLLVSMRNVQRVDPDGIGCLLEARRLLYGRRLLVRLSDLTPAIRRVLYFSGVMDLFPIAGSKRGTAHASVLAAPAGSQGLAAPLQCRSDT